MECSSIRFSRHAIQRMFEHGISVDPVVETLSRGETVEEYPDDTPHPSSLLLGWSDARPVHVVVSQDPASMLCVVITVYVPDSIRWDKDFKRRRKP
jgi:hypothetical protein